MVSDTFHILLQAYTVGMTATVWDGRDGLELAVSSSFTSPFLKEAESGRTHAPLMR
jgi:hypothetical protein